MKQLRKSRAKEKNDKVSRAQGNAQLQMVQLESQCVLSEIACFP